jgi:hypothetical protein
MAETSTASSEVGEMTVSRLALYIAGWLVVLWGAASILIVPLSVTLVTLLVGLLIMPLSIPKGGWKAKSPAESRIGWRFWLFYLSGNVVLLIGGYILYHVVGEHALSHWVPRPIAWGMIWNCGIFGGRAIVISISELRNRPASAA